MHLTVDRAQALEADDATSLQAVHAALCAEGARLRGRSTAELWSSPALSRVRDAVAVGDDARREAA